MAAPLARLRADLDVMPSPLPEQPGRTPVLFVPLLDRDAGCPPLLAQCLSCFDGEHDEDDLRALLTRLTGRAAIAPIAKPGGVAEGGGFSDDDRFAEMRGQREREFAAGTERASAHAGSGYPDERAALTKTLTGYFDGRRSKGDTNGKGAAIGIAAPTSARKVARGATPTRIGRSGRTTGADLRRRRHLALRGAGSVRHHPQAVLDAVWRGAHRTPVARSAGGGRPRRGGGRGLLSRGSSISVEFQVVFLQYLLGPRVRIVPIPRGAFVAGPQAGRPPGHSGQVERFLGALGELAAREGDWLRFVLGVDFAHIGRRYGDPRPARAHAGPLQEVEQCDRARLARVAAGDAGAFWDLVYEGGDDDLRWCGSSPLYSFLRAVPQAAAGCVVRTLEHRRGQRRQLGAMAFDGRATQARRKPSAGK